MKNIVLIFGLICVLCPSGLFGAADRNGLNGTGSSTPQPEPSAVCAVCHNEYCGGLCFQDNFLSPTKPRGAAASIKKGIFTIDRPLGLGSGWAVHRWDEREESLGRQEAGCAAVIVTGNSNGFYHDSPLNPLFNLCRETAVKLPFKLSKMSQAGLDNPARVIVQLIDKINKRCADPTKMFQDSFMGNCSAGLYDIKQFALLVRYGQMMLRATGEKTDDQSTALPEIRVSTEAYEPEHTYELTIAGKTTPIIKMQGVCTAAVVSEGISTSALLPFADE